MSTFPEFELPATGTDSKTLKSSDLKGKWSVVYFYPKDNTPGCTTETLDFIGLKSEFETLNTQIIGWNNNPISLHEKFTTKHSIPFPLVTDEGLETMEALNIWQLKKFMGKEFMGVVRTTLILNPEAEIVKRYDKVKVKGHAQSVLEDLKEIQASGIRR